MQDTIMTNGEKWEFDKAVTECFDDMLERSIPEYEHMRSLTYSIGSRFVKPKTAIIDLGCSNGNAIEPFVNKFGIANQYILYDVSEPMLEECKKRFDMWLKAMTGIVVISNQSITEDIRPLIHTSLVLSILTLQFTPIEYRQKIVQNVYDTLDDGGAFILVEKVLGNSYDLDKLLVDEYYKMKAEHQYSEEQIRDKRKSLEGVLVPITAKWNEELLKQAGFTHVDCFWRCLNFAGWIAVKK